MEEKETAVVPPEEKEKTPPEKVSVLQTKTINVNAKKNCSKCYGTGRKGYIEGNKNRPLPCQCVKKQIEALKKEGKVDANTRITLNA